MSKSFGWVIRALFIAGITGFSTWKATGINELSWGIFTVVFLLIAVFYNPATRYLRFASGLITLLIGLTTAPSIVAELKIETPWTQIFVEWVSNGGDEVLTIILSLLIIFCLLLDFMRTERITRNHIIVIFLFILTIIGLLFYLFSKKHEPIIEPPKLTRELDFSGSGCEDGKIVDIVKVTDTIRLSEKVGWYNYEFRAKEGERLEEFDLRDLNQGSDTNGFDRISSNDRISLELKVIDNEAKVTWTAKDKNYCASPDRCGLPESQKDIDPLSLHPPGWITTTVYRRSSQYQEIAVSAIFPESTRGKEVMNWPKEKFPHPDIQSGLLKRPNDDGSETKGSKTWVSSLFIKSGEENKHCTLQSDRIYCSQLPSNKNAVSFLFYSPLWYEWYACRL